MTTPPSTELRQPYVWVPESPQLRLPLVFDSPHSWQRWPDDVATLARPDQLMTSCDAYVDELWADGVADVGGALLAARFHRAFIDANRSEMEVDTDLIEGTWPHPVEPSDRTRRGMGLIRRYALPRVPLYARRLTVEDVQSRIETLHRPYRKALGEAIETAHARFGCVWHVNCHSMKSVGNAMNVDCGTPRPDIVVSDSPRGGCSAAPEFTRWVAQHLGAHGYAVAINTPYTGGDIVQACGEPARQRHSIQIEINRALYMDEATFTRHSGFNRLKAHLAVFVQELAEYVEARLDSRQTTA